MKVLCVEDGSIDVDAITEIENRNLINGKVLVYRQGSRPPFVIDIPNLGTPRALKELRELKAMLDRDLEHHKYGSCEMYGFISNYLTYLIKRIDQMEDELNSVDDKGE